MLLTNLVEKTPFFVLNWSNKKSSSGTSNNSNIKVTGDNSIAVYKIANDGCLELVEIIPTNGKTPRDFNITPDQQYIIAVHQDSDNATVFKRDSETGKLTEISHDFYVPEAVCVTFYS